MIDDKQNYTGWINWTPTADEWAQFYLDQIPPFEMKENQYLIVHSDGYSTLTYCWEHGKLRKFTGGSIKTFKSEQDQDEIESSLEQKKKKSTKNKYSKGKSTVITPRNTEQACAFDLFKDHDKTVKLITGTWGTGKTMIMVNAGLEALKDGLFEK